MSARRSSCRVRRRGFTLVEMLVVIFIIGLLAALLLPALAGAVAASQRTAMAMEIAGLSQGIEAYYQDKGDYPPNFLSTDYTTAPSSGTPNYAYHQVLQRHLQKCFPKMNAADAYGKSGSRFFAGGFANSIDEAEALVFWLCLTTTDPRQPFCYNKTGSNFDFTNLDRKIYFDFDLKRLDDNDSDGFYSYRPKYGKNSHYTYYDGRLASVAPMGDFKYSEVPGARPYYNIVNSKPIAETKFQIVCAGLDGEFGVASNPKGIPFGGTGGSPANLTAEDMDNQTSFSEGKRLKDVLP